MKSILKSLANLLATIVVTPALLIYGPCALVVGSHRAFPGWSQFFSLIPGILGVYLRRAFYHVVMPSSTLDCWIGFGTVFSGVNCRIGHNVYIGVFGCLGEVTIEDDVLLGSHVSVLNGGEQHGIERLDIPIREQPGKLIPITIGRDTWIGDRALILADVGKHCVIGAGSIVTKPIPDHAIAVGAPARVIRYRNGDEKPQTESEALEKAVS